MYIYNRIKIVAILAIALFLFVGNTSAQFFTDTVGGLYLKSWDPVITTAQQWVSDTTFLGLKSRGFYVNGSSSNDDQVIIFEKYYDTLRPVPLRWVVWYRGQTDADLGLGFEFIHGDSTQNGVTYILLQNESNFTKTYTEVDVNNGPAMYNGIRIRIGLCCQNTARWILLARLMAVYGMGDSAVVEDFSAPPKFQASDTAVDFDTVVVGGTKADSVVISNTGEWRLKFSDVSINNALFTMGSFPSELNAGDSIILPLYYSPVTAESTTGHLIFTHDGTSSPDTITLTGTGYLPDSSMAILTGLDEGWQLVSRPFEQLAEGSFNPSPVYTFGSSYVLEDTTMVGPGYWHKYTGNGQIIFVGYNPPTEVTVSLHPRWNIVGTPGSPVKSTNVTTEPPGITVSQFYGYDGNAYFVADTLLPGHGYWVKTTSDGSMTVSAAPGNNPAARVQIVPTDELPPAPPVSGEARLSPPVPSEFKLAQNYPNPFNPVTSITFVIPNHESGIMNHEFVSLKIFNLLGQEVTTLVDGYKDPGSHTVTWNASQLPSGVYVYRLQAGSYIATNKMILLR